MEVRINRRCYTLLVKVNPDRAKRLLKLSQELMLSAGVLSEAKLDLMIRYALMVKKDINNQILEGGVINGLRKEKGKEEKNVLKQEALNQTEGEV